MILSSRARVRAAAVSVCLAGAGLVATATSTSASADEAFPLPPSLVVQRSYQAVVAVDGAAEESWLDGEGRDVGVCSTASAGCLGHGEQRQVIRFAPMSLTAVKILDVSVTISRTASADCKPHRFVLSSIWEWLDSPLSYPFNGDVLANPLVPSAGGPLCPAGSGSDKVTFHDGRLTKAVTDLALGRTGTLSLSLSSGDRYSVGASASFAGDAALRIVYVPLPEKPGGLGTFVGDLSPECSTNPSKPLLTFSKPFLTARVGPGNQLPTQVVIEVQRKNGPGWVPFMANLTGSLDADNVKATLENLSPGVDYRYRALARSSYQWRNGPTTISSKPTAWCYVQPVPDPTEPQVVASAPYIPCTATNCKPTGYAGEPVTITFSPGRAADKIRGYSYTLSDGTQFIPGNAWGSTASITYTPAEGKWGVYVVPLAVGGGVGPTTSMTWRTGPARETPTS